ncbi:MAG: hypothetical protein JO159_11315 [Acidobacteria bacterium]|nr:hypothetical protein [Acidobacteriota bacterium]
MSTRVILLAALTVALSSLAAAADQEAGTAKVSFTLDFPDSNPSHYEIIVNREGHGSYRSNGQLSQESEAVDPQTLEFTLSEKVRQEIFDLAKRAHYFSGKLDSGRKNLANTGAKTLRYDDGQRSSEATFNYSALAPVQQLTSIFQNLSTTLEFGRRLVFFHKYQKLALEEDLRRMEELERTNGLGDLESIAPVLENIAHDPAVMNVTRARALRLLATVHSGNRAGCDAPGSFWHKPSPLGHDDSCIAYNHFQVAGNLS